MLQEEQARVGLWLQTFLTDSSWVLLQQPASQVWALQQALLLWMTLTLLVAVVV